VSPCGCYLLKSRAVGEPVGRPPAASPAEPAQPFRLPARSAFAGPLAFPLTPEVSGAAAGSQTRPDVEPPLGWTTVDAVLPFDCDAPPPVPEALWLPARLTSAGPASFAPRAEVTGTATGPDTTPPDWEPPGCTTVDPVLPFDCTAPPAPPRALWLPARFTSAGVLPLAPTPVDAGATTGE